MFSNLLASDATTQRSQNSRTEKMEQALQCSKVEKDDKSASILRKTPKMVIERRVAKHQQKSNVQNGTDLLKSDQLSKGLPSTSI
uniref:Bm14164 n=1 Tax=Brugia malayi TaxID=6279 RepID=A0A0J9YB10_BRUMA|nr:Bm14164 [Brugia malayi]